MIKKYNQFIVEKLTNKFNFIINKIYSFDELPIDIQKDIELQFDEFSELKPIDYKYVAKILKPIEIEEYLFNSFGEYNIQDVLEEPYMINLINDINKNGLDYPIVGIEGNHRSLALYHLNKDIPYLEMVEIN